MEVVRYGAEKDRGPNCSKSEDEDFRWMGVFCSKTEWSGILMVDFMDVFVEGTPMQTSMGPIMECIFHDKEDCDLPCHGRDVGEGNIDEKTKVVYYRMEQVYLR